MIWILGGIALWLMLTGIIAIIVVTMLTEFDEETSTDSTEQTGKGL